MVVIYDVRDKESVTENEIKKRKIEQKKNQIKKKKSEKRGKGHELEQKFIQQR